MIEDECLLSRARRYPRNPEGSTVLAPSAVLPRVGTRRPAVPTRGHRFGMHALCSALP